MLPPQAATLLLLTPSCCLAAASVTDIDCIVFTLTRLLVAPAAKHRLELLDVILLRAATAAAVPQQKFAETLPPAAKCRDAAVVKQTLLLCCSFLSLCLPLQREAVAVSFLYLFSDYCSSMVTSNRCDRMVFIPNVH